VRKATEYTALPLRAAACAPAGSARLRLPPASRALASYTASTPLASLTTSRAAS
jgi:hypothetical protein